MPSPAGIGGGREVASQVSSVIILACELYSTAATLVIIACLHLIVVHHHHHRRRKNMCHPWDVSQLCVCVLCCVVLCVVSLAHNMFNASLCMLVLLYVVGESTCISRQQ